MRIELNLLELVSLQKVSRYPGSRVNFNMDEMVTYGLVEKHGNGYKLTEGGKLVLRIHEPFLCCGQDMSEPIGHRRKKPI